jgi:hypothetical protein
MLGIEKLKHSTHRQSTAQRCTRELMKNRHVLVCNIVLHGNSDAQSKKKDVRSQTLPLGPVHYLIVCALYLFFFPYIKDQHVFTVRF